MSSQEPGQAEVLGWLSRNGGSPIAAARHFFPGLPPEAHEKLADKYRKWQKRHGGRGTASTAPTGQPQVAAVATLPPVPEEPRHDLAELSLLDKLLRLEAQAWTDLEAARRARDHRGIALHRGQIAELGTQIEAVRRQQGGTTPLQPIPAVVAKDIVEESKAIRALVEAVAAVEELQRQQPQGAQPREE